jgi:hypothetical protein
MTQVPPGDQARALKRAARGRSKVYGTLTKVTLSLDEQTKDYLHRLGGGSMSHGVRVLVAWHREQKK